MKLWNASSQFLCWRILAIAVLLFATLTPWSKAEADNPWASLDGFEVVRGSGARIAENYFAALFENPKEDLVAIVIFNAHCDSRRCTVKRRAAYAIFTAEGLNTTVYVDPRDEEKLNSLMTRQGTLL